MPTPQQVHEDAALTDFSVAYFHERGSTIARKMFSPTPSAKQSDRYFVYSKADLLRSDAQPYSGKGATAGRDYGLSKTSYYIEEWALHYDVSRNERANADAVLDPEEDAARLVMDDLMIAEEREWAATAFATGVWGTDVTGGTNFTVWSDAASTPIENLRTGITTILQNTGRKPNKLGMGWNTWATGLADHPDLLDRIKHTQTGVVTEALLAGVLGIDEVHVGMSVRNTAAEGLTASMSFNTGSHALLLHAPNTSGPRLATGGRTFVWSGLTGNADGILAERFDIPEEGAYPRVQCITTFGHIVTGTDLGYFFASAV
jgi:hypothetical protein